MQNVEKIAHKAIGAAIEVHRQLGPGLLESAYKQCLYYELSEVGIYAEAEKPMPVTYKKVTLDHGYWMDLVLGNQLVLEIKTVEALTDVHTAHLLPI